MKKKKSYTLPSEMSYDGTSSQNAEEIVNLFASYFSTVYSNEKVNQIPNITPRITIDVHKYSIELREIIDLVLELPYKLSSGPDGVPLYLIKNCIFTLAKPLAFMYNISLSTGSFPEYWKQSYLKPIFKSGSKNEVKNYRGVCNQSEFPKIFDKLITNKLTWDCKNIIINQQHGFCQGRSTTTNLVLYQNFINSSLENRKQVDALYTDFSKAFDQVNHNLMIVKLKALGIDGKVLEWIKSYLMDRIQFVKYGNYLSHHIYIPSGVPQGSHLGPLLFNLFINDITDVIKYSNVLMFADDLKMFKIINDVEDGELLQEDLTNLVRWCKINMLKLNIQKCFQISFFKIKDPIEFRYRICNEYLSVTNSIKDLGVIFDSKLTFKPHIDNIISRALKQLGFIYRTSNHFSAYTFKILYCSLVRSIMEYNSVIWHPSYHTDINSLENVQHKFLRYYAYKMGFNRYDYNYDSIMTILNLKTLENRRLEADLTFMHKVINGICDCPEILALFNFNCVSRRTRFTDIFRMPVSRTNFGQNGPLNRLMKVGNAHNRALELFNSSLSSFKKSIKR